MNQAPGDKFMLSTEIATKFKFKEVVKPRFPKLFKSREQLKRKALKSIAAKPTIKVDPNKETEEDNINKEIQYFF